MEDCHISNSEQKQHDAKREPWDNADIMQSTKSRSTLTYVVYGFLAVFALTCAGIGFLVWKFTPLYQIDEKTDQVRLFGGYVQLDGRHGSLQIGGKKLESNTANQHFEGKTPFREFSGGRGSPFLPENAQLMIRIRGGDLDLSTASGTSLEWKCETPPMGQPPQIQQIRAQMVLDLSHGSFGRCRATVPGHLTVAIEARDARVEMAHPAFDIHLDAKNSKVIYRRDPSLAYRFEPLLDSSRMIGLQSFPPPSSAPDAVWAGMILRFGTLVLE